MHASVCELARVLSLPDLAAHNNGQKRNSWLSKEFLALAIYFSNIATGHVAEPVLASCTSLPWCSWSLILFSLT